MNKGFQEKKNYQTLVDACRKRREGASIADLVAATALPLEKVRELVPSVADEYSARLRVTESGEILYSFPQGFRSKYRGFRANLNRLLDKATSGLVKVATWLFKVWIMVMLVGYFILFMAIALVALAASIAVSSSGSNSRSSSRRGGGLGGLYIASHIFNLVIRLWFYSEITKSADRTLFGLDSYGRPVKRPKGRPLHHAVFSFVFGDGDPNADWKSRERLALIAYIQSNKGVISLPEFMALTGFSVQQAQDTITAYCVEFGGSPEATEEGTVVYRFDKLLLRSDKTDRSFSGLSAPIQRLKKFSNNTRKMNGWFMALNGFNLAFGAYFLINGMNASAIFAQTQIQGSSYLFAVAYVLFSGFIADPLPLLLIGLGVVPIIFALLFYLVPLLRNLFLKQDNEAIKLRNLRKEVLRRVWDHPMGIKAKDINPAAEECRPKDLSESREHLLKELGTYSTVNLNALSDGMMEYSFDDLVREKEALHKYRATISDEVSDLGKTIFDSHGETID